MRVDRRLVVLCVGMAWSCAGGAVFVERVAAETRPVTEAVPAVDSSVRYWLVRTYGLGDPGTQVADVQHLDIQRLAGDRWEISTPEQLAVAASERRTVVYVHGNRSDDASAIARGMTIGAQLSARADAPPLQVLIWSWPSGQVQRGRKDFRAKSERTDTEAWYLGALLRQFSPHAEVSFLGYSYGARVVTGALHWKAGGEFEARTLSAGGDAGANSKYRVALLAPAVHWDWIAIDGTHGAALSVTERMLVLYNPCDPALRWYRFVYRCERPDPLGRYGIGDDWLGEASARVDQWNVSPVIGKTHDEDAYLTSSWIFGQIGTTLLPPRPSSVGSGD